VEQRCEFFSKDEDFVTDYSINSLLLDPAITLFRYQELTKGLCQETPQTHHDYQALRIACDKLDDIISRLSSTEVSVDELEDQELSQLTKRFNSIVDWKTNSKKLTLTTKKNIRFRTWCCH